MRVKVRSKEDYVEVVNTETGELLEGVSSISLHADRNSRSLVIRLVDYDMGVDMAAVVLDKDGLDIGSQSCGDDCACRPPSRRRS